MRSRAHRVIRGAMSRLYPMTMTSELPTPSLMMYQRYKMPLLHPARMVSMVSDVIIVSIY